MNILLTGVSKGLGLKSAELFLKKGWTVYGISRSNSEALQVLSNKYLINIPIIYFCCNMTYFILIILEI
jgi:NAD(P)-dependent dehydrogenase (short-subunit alcohol dehydrogenase family)